MAHRASMYRKAFEEREAPSQRPFGTFQRYLRKSDKWPESVRVEVRRADWGTASRLLLRLSRAQDSLVGLSQSALTALARASRPPVSVESRCGAMTLG